MKKPEAKNTYKLPTGEPIRLALKTAFKAQRKQILASLSGKKAEPELPDAMPPFRLGDLAMSERMALLIEAYWDQSGTQLLSNVDVDPDAWDVRNPEVEAAIEKASLDFSASTNQTTSLALDKALSETRKALIAGVYTKGESLVELTKRVNAIFDQAETWRARRIAASEASRAVHAGQESAAIKSGVVLGWEWLLSEDACPLCQTVGRRAKFVRIGQPFAVVGDHPTYANVKHPPLHPSCQCSFREIVDQSDLPAELRDPEPDWASTLNQPKPEEQDKPPKPEPKPKPEKPAKPGKPGKPGKPKPKPTKPIPTPNPEPAVVVVVPPANSPAGEAIPPKPEPAKPPAVVIPSPSGPAPTEPPKPAKPPAPAVVVVVPPPTPTPTVGEVIPPKPKPKTVVERIADYAEGDRKLAALRAKLVDTEDAKQLTKDAMDFAKSGVLNPDAVKFYRFRQARAAETEKANRAAVLEALALPQPGKVGGDISKLRDKGLKARAAEAQDFVSRITHTGNDDGVIRINYVQAGGRAHYEHARKLISLGNDSPAETVAHELGHAIDQHIPGAQKAVAEFLEYRRAGEAAKPIGEGYGKDEIGFDDEFRKAFGIDGRYVGKVYKSGATEILSMGIEKLYSDPYTFIHNDPEFAKLVIGVLDGSLR